MHEDSKKRKTKKDGWICNSDVGLSEVEQVIEGEKSEVVIVIALWLGLGACVCLNVRLF